MMPCKWSLQMDPSDPHLPACLPVLLLEEFLVIHNVCVRKAFQIEMR